MSKFLYILVSDLFILKCNKDEFFSYHRLHYESIISYEFLSEIDILSLRVIYIGYYPVYLFTLVTSMYILSPNVNITAAYFVCILMVRLVVLD